MRTIRHPAGYVLPVLQDRINEEVYDPDTNTTGEEPFDLNDPEVDHVQLVVKSLDLTTTIVDAPMTRAAGEDGDVSYAWQGGETGTLNQASRVVAQEFIHMTSGAIQPVPAFYIDFYDVSVPVPVPPGGPCTSWVTEQDLRDCATCDAGEGADYLAAAGIASYLLYKLSGERFSGLCTSTVRPSRRCHHWTRYEQRGSWSGTAWYGYNGCGCTRELRLYGYPIRDVLEVTIDGDVLDPACYRVDDAQTLVRIDGDHWPACQNPYLDTGEGVFEVTYTHGADVPALGRLAATQLGCEVAKLCGGDASTCEIPAHAIGINRRGTSYQLAPRERVGGSAKTEERILTAVRGLDAVALFLRDANPSGRRRRPMIMSPDTMQHRRMG